MISCSLLHIDPPVTRAAMTIVVEYNQWLIRYTRREYFSFTGVSTDSGWQWLEVSPDDTRNEVDEAIRRHDESNKAYENFMKREGH